MSPEQLLGLFLFVGLWWSSYIEEGISMFERAICSMCIHMSAKINEGVDMQGEAVAPKMRQTQMSAYIGVSSVEVSQPFESTHA